MAQNKINKLELTWIGKEDEPLAIEPRLLLDTPEYSFGEVETGTLPNGKPWPGNMLIHGDNLLALRALEENFAGAVKCIYIDPPFNTGQAFEYYDDNIEHSLWLNLMYHRFLSMYRLLKYDGMLWVHLDDEEVHYSKVMLDSIFSRENFVSHITYERSGVAGLGQGGYLVNTTEHILLYKKGTLPSKNNLIYSELELNIMRRYNRIITDYGTKVLVKEFVSKSNGKPVKVFRHMYYKITSISLRNIEANRTEIMSLYVENLERIFRGNRVQKENKFQNDLIADMEKDSLYSVEYTPSRGKYENSKTVLYYYNNELLSFLSDTASIIDNKVVKSQKMTTLWTHSEIPKADIAHEGDVYFPRGKKPEQLLKRIIEMSTNPGDLVLDSFLGSGTTAAVAHKMGRKWIGVELGDHAYTHCAVRMKKVIEGEQGGISKSQNWQGGGGFRFYELAPSLLNHDKYGNLVINKDYNADMLAAAMAKHQGFTFSPDPEMYWKQGHSSEHDFIFTTTQLITAEMLESIHDQLGEDESLLICCSKFQPECRNKYSNITIKKIPKVLLDTCEFDHDDYSLNIVSVPEIDDEEWDDTELNDNPMPDSESEQSEEPNLFNL